MSPAHYIHSPLPAVNAPKPAGGRAGDHYGYDHDSPPGLSLVISRRKAVRDEEKEEECFGQGLRRLSAGGDGFAFGAGREGGGRHRTYERGTSAGASILPGGVPACYCPPQQWCESPPSGCAKIADSGRRCRGGRSNTRTEAGDAHVFNVSHAERRRPCNECAHRCCINVDARRHRGGDSSRDSHESVAVAGVKVAGTAAAAAAAPPPDAVGVGEDLRSSEDLDGCRGPLSRAAVEAWEAAETWASAVAAATGEVAATGRSLASAETAEKSVCKKVGKWLGETAAVESDHHRRKNWCDVEAEERIEDGYSSCCRCAWSGGAAGVLDIRQSALHRRDRVLVCGGSSGGSTGTTGGVCHSAVHRRDSVLCRSSKAQVGAAALKFVGRVPGMGASKGSSSSSSTTSTCPPFLPTRTLPASDERPFDASGSGRNNAPSAWNAVPATVRPTVVGAAAAIVLERIDRGEKLRGRHARRAGLAALKDHRTRARRQKKRGATAARFHEAALRARGLRALGALVDRRKGRGKAAVAAAAATAAAVANADAFAWEQRMRRVVAMLQRNFQARMALRSRDDLADLHFAEWRIPFAVRVWRGRTRARRSCRYSDALATSKWRSKSLPAAFARWVGHSLGNAEKRRRLLVWREALSTQTPPSLALQPQPDSGSDSTPRGDDGVHGEQRLSETNEGQLSQHGRVAERADTRAVMMVQHSTTPPALSLHPPSGPGSLPGVPARVAAAATPLEGVAGGGLRSSPAGEHRPQEAKGLQVTVVTGMAASDDPSTEGSQEGNVPGHGEIVLNGQRGEAELEETTSPGRGELDHSAGDTLAIRRKCVAGRTNAPSAQVQVYSEDIHPARVCETEEEQIILAGDTGSLGGVERGSSRDGSQGQRSTVGTDSILSCTSTPEAKGCDAKESGAGSAARHDAVDGSGEESERGMDVLAVAQASAMATTIELSKNAPPESSSSSRKSDSGGSSRSSSSSGLDSEGSRCRTFDDGDEGEQPRHSTSEDVHGASSSLEVVHVGNVPERTSALTSAERLEETTACVGRTSSARGSEQVARTRLIREAQASPEEEQEEEEEDATDPPGLYGLTICEGQKSTEGSKRSALSRCASCAVLDRTTRPPVDGGEAATAGDTERHGTSQSSPVEADSTLGRETTPSAASSSSSPVSAPYQNISGVNAVTEDEQQQQEQQQQREWQRQLPTQEAITAASPATTADGNHDVPRRLRRTGKEFCILGGAGEFFETEQSGQSFGPGEDAESRPGSTGEDSVFAAGAARGVGDNNVDVDAVESPPLSWVSASRAEEIRSNEGRNLARTLSGGWLLSSGKWADTDSSFRGARNDDETAGGSSTAGADPQNLGDPDMRSVCTRSAEEVVRRRTSVVLVEEGTPQSAQYVATERRESANNETHPTRDSAPRGAVPRDPAPIPPSLMLSPGDAEIAGTANLFARAELSATAEGTSAPGSTEERQSSSTPRSPPTSRTSTSDSAETKSTEKTSGIIHIRPVSASAPASASASASAPASAPRERQDPPSARRQAHTPLLSLSDLGLGSVPAAHISAPEAPPPPARRTPAAAIRPAGATGGHCLQPRNVGDASSLAMGRRGETLDARAGVVLTFPAPGQAASSELSCMSWSDHRGAGSVGQGGGDGDSFGSRGSSTSSGESSSKRMRSACSDRSGERSSTRGKVQGKSDSSGCSSSGSRRTRCGGDSGMEASRGAVSPTPDGAAAAHATPCDDANGVRARLDAPATGRLKLPARASSSSSSSPPSSPSLPTLASGSEGRTSRTPESENNYRIDHRAGDGSSVGEKRSGSGGGESSSRSKNSSIRRLVGNRSERGNSQREPTSFGEERSESGGGNNSGRRKCSSIRRPASSSGGGADNCGQKPEGANGGENDGQRPPERIVPQHVPVPCSGSHSSGSRRRETLEERVSEAFLRRRLLETALGKWQRWTASITFRRRSTHSLAACALAFAKRAALARWLAAHAHLRTLKAAEASRRSRLPLRGRDRLASQMSGSSPAAHDTAAVAVAIVIIRRWHRRSVAKLLLRHAFDGWSTRARRSRDVATHRRRALARRGLAGWRRAAQEAGRARGRTTAVAFFMSRAAGRRRLRAWLQRRRRRIDNLQAADDHRALAGLSPAAARWRRHRRRDERLRAEAALRSWKTRARERAASRSARCAAVAGAEGRRRRRAVEAWRDWAARRRQWRCLLADVTAIRARWLGREGLQGLESGARAIRARLEAVRVAEEHWIRRGTTVFTAFRNLVKSRRRLFRRASALRLRIAARAGLYRWRRVVQNTRVARDARIKGDSWRRRKATRAGVSALFDSSDRRVAQDRAMCAGRLHFSRALARRAAASWCVWTRRQLAATELYDAATALHSSWIASAGLRALDRVARARIWRREAAHTAHRHLLRTRGLRRWRAAAVARAHARGQAGIATVHWATTLSSKVLVCWAAAAIQQWAESRQEEAAAKHERIARKRKGLRAWMAAVFGHPGNVEADRGPRLFCSAHRHGSDPGRPPGFSSRETTAACCPGVRSQPLPCVPLLKPEGRSSNLAQQDRYNDFARVNPLY
eukprot:g5537.t1